MTPVCCTHGDAGSDPCRELCPGAVVPQSTQIPTRLTRNVVTSGCRWLLLCYRLRLSEGSRGQGWRRKLSSKARCGAAATWSQGRQVMGLEAHSCPLGSK